MFAGRKANTVPGWDAVKERSPMDSIGKDLLILLFLSYISRTFLAWSTSLCGLRLSVLRSSARARRESYPPRGALLPPLLLERREVDAAYLQNGTLCEPNSPAGKAMVKIRFLDLLAALF